MTKASDPSKSNRVLWHQLGWVIFGIVLIGLIFYYGTQTLLGNSEDTKRLTIYAFSTQEEVLSNGIFPAFEKYWEGKTGEDIQIDAVYGPSATLAGQINLGAPAEIVIFSNSHHAAWLNLGKMLNSDNQPVIFGYTPMVIVTRSGNPANINNFSDLEEKGLKIIHPDPRSSGAGEWSVLAEYGSALLNTNIPEEAENVLKNIWYNVSLLGSSARSSLSFFELGAGDALITYEQDARLAFDRGVPLEIIIPSHTIAAEHIALIVDKNVSSKEQELTQTFIDFLLTDDAQSIFNNFHLRPISSKQNNLSPIKGLFNVQDLGGWTYAYDQIIEKIWKKEIEPNLNFEEHPAFIRQED